MKELLISMNDFRETWGSDNNFDNFTVRTLFMCGLPENHEVQKALNLEYDLLVGYINS